MSKWNLAEMVNPGHERFWVVEHNPRNSKNPIKVTLREYTVIRGAGDFGTPPHSLSKVLASENAIASRSSIVAAAKTVLERVGAVNELVGVYEC